jgi:hypothetical protein
MEQWCLPWDRQQAGRAASSSEARDCAAATNDSNRLRRSSNALPRLHTLAPILVIARSLNRLGELPLVHTYMHQPISLSENLDLRVPASRGNITPERVVPKVTAYEDLSID